MDYAAAVQDYGKRLGIPATDTDCMISKLWEHLTLSDEQCLEVMNKHTSGTVTKGTEFANLPLFDAQAAESGMQDVWQRRFYASANGTTYKQTLTKEEKATTESVTNPTLRSMFVEDIPTGYIRVGDPSTLLAPFDRMPEELPYAKYHHAAIASCDEATKSLHKTVIQLRKCEETSKADLRSLVSTKSDIASEFFRAVTIKTDASQEAKKLKKELRLLISYAYGTLDSMMDVGEVSMSHLQQLVDMPDNSLVAADMCSWKLKKDAQQLRARFRYGREHIRCQQLGAQKRITEMLAMCGDNVRADRLVSSKERKTALDNLLRARAEEEKLEDDSSSARVYSKGATVSQSSTSPAVPQRAEANATIEPEISVEDLSLGSHQLERLLNGCFRVNWVQRGRSQAASDPTLLYVLGRDSDTAKVSIISGASLLAKENHFDINLEQELGHEWLSAGQSSKIVQVGNDFIRKETVRHISEGTMARFSQEAVEMFSETRQAHGKKANELLDQIFSSNESSAIQATKEKLAVHSSQMTDVTSLMYRFANEMNAGVIDSHEAMREKATAALGDAMTEEDLADIEKRVSAARRLADNFPDMVAAHLTSKSSAASGELQEAQEPFDPWLESRVQAERRDSDSESLTMIRNESLSPDLTRSHKKWDRQRPKPSRRRKQAKPGPRFTPRREADAVEEKTEEEEEEGDSSRNPLSNLENLQRLMEFYKPAAGEQQSSSGSVTKASSRQEVSRYECGPGHQFYRHVRTPDGIQPSKFLKHYHDKHPAEYASIDIGNKSFVLSDQTKGD